MSGGSPALTLPLTFRLRETVWLWLLLVPIRFRRGSSRSEMALDFQAASDRPDLAAWQPVVFRAVHTHVTETRSEWGASEEVGFAIIATLLRGSDRINHRGVQSVLNKAC